MAITYSRASTLSRVSVTTRGATSGGATSGSGGGTTTQTTPTLYERNFDNETSLTGTLALVGGSLDVFSLDSTVYDGSTGKSLKAVSSNQLHNIAYDTTKTALSGSCVLTQTIRLSSTDTNNSPRAGIVGRINTTNLTGFALIARPQIGNSTIRISSFSGATETVISTETLDFQLSPNSFYYQKFSMNGSALKGKIWLKGDAEPDTWQIETVDVTYTPDTELLKTVGVYHFSANTGTDIAYIDSIIESAVDNSAPVVGTALGEPFALTAPSFPSKNTHSLTPSSTIWADYSAPYPTNKSFTNSFMDTNSDTFKIHPYNVQTRNDSLKVCYPSRTTSTSSIIEGFLENLNIKASETLLNHKITHWDQFSVKHKWVTSGAEYMESPLVKGSPYTSMYYSGLTPLITTIHAITSVNGSGFSGTFTGTKFKIVMNNGQTWIFYFDSSVTLTASTVGNYHLTATSAYTGWMRIACLITAGDETVLDTYKAKIPTAGALSMSVSGNTATLGINWTTTGTGTLAMCCLPHHQDVLTSPTPQSALQYVTMKGSMKAVYGESWSWQETLTTITWDAPRSIDADKEATVRSALASDYTVTPSAVDPYFGGKSVAKSGRLALIADVLSETSKATTIRNNMKSVMNAWITGTSNPNIIYESKWGGLCMERAITNVNQDFTSGYYSDHHFHWGYWIYAAACLAKEDPTWLTTYQSNITDFVREICNPSTDDPYYTQFRHFDWFESHSWASGLFKFGDGGNQESSSEAVNAWYAVYLWGLVTGNDNMKDIGRILLASEIRGAQKYWQIKSADSIYGSPFNAKKVVGVLWQTKVDYATFFGGNTEYIHEIQTLPVTPIMELLLESDWVTEEYPVLETDALNRSYPIAASIVNGGSGYSGSNGSYTQGGATFVIANNVDATGGSGTGLKFNMNIRQSTGAITEVFVVSGSEGTGYLDGDIVTLVSPSGGLTGGSGVSIRLVVEPAQGWLSFIYSKHSIIDKATAWTEIQSLTGFDDGLTKTAAYYFVATRP